MQEAIWKVAICLPIGVSEHIRQLFWMLVFLGRVGDLTWEGDFPQYDTCRQVLKSNIYLLTNKHWQKQNGIIFNLTKTGLKS